MRTFRRFTTLVPALLAATALLLAACGDDGDEEQAVGSPDDVVSTTLEDTGDATVPDLPTNDDPAAVQCTGPPGGVFDATAAVGLTVNEASEVAQTEGCSIRVAMRDGEGLALTEDFRPDRVNVAVEGGEVTEILSIG